MPRQKLIKKQADIKEGIALKIGQGRKGQNASTDYSGLACPGASSISLVKLLTEG